MRNEKKRKIDIVFYNYKLKASTQEKPNLMQTELISFFLVHVFLVRPSKHSVKLITLSIVSKTNVSYTVRHCPLFINTYTQEQRKKLCTLN